LLESERSKPERTELIFIDGSVEEADQLLEELQNSDSSDTEWIIVELDSSRNGIDEITETLEGIKDIDAIHIISHGNGQGLKLGTEILTSENYNQYRYAIDNWRDTFTIDGDLLIYGCDLASTEDGKALLADLAASCDCDVAASDDTTGHTNLNADWDLEYNIGKVTTDVALPVSVQSGWHNTLLLDNAPTNLSSGIELNIDGGNDAFFATTDASSLLGGLSELTIEMTFVAADTGSQTLFVYSTPGQDSLALELDQNGNLLFEVNEVDFVSTAIDYNSAKDGQIHSLSVSWDSAHGTVNIYLDGELVESTDGYQTNETVAANASNSLTIGQETDSPSGNYDSTQTFRGILYDFRVWDDVRSQAEVQLNYQQKIDPNNLPDNLIANWQMEELTGLSNDTLIDIVAMKELTLGHATGAGFSESIPVPDLHTVEDIANGTSVGVVIPTNPDVFVNLIEDGGFHQDTLPNTLQAKSAGDPLGAWTIEVGQIEVGTSNVANGPQGGLPIELGNNRGGIDETGRISQTIATEPGTEYQLTFALTGDWTGGGEAVKDIEIAAGAATTQIQLTEPDNWSKATPLWEPRTVTFLASSATTTISFESLDTSSPNNTVLITDVEVTEVPPGVSTILSNDPSLTYDAGTNKFYQVSTGTNTQAGAQLAANNNLLNGLAGQLVTIRSPHENALVTSLTSGIHNRVYIGGTDATTENTWNWIENGVEADTFYTAIGSVPNVYENFQPPEPDSAAGDEDALVLSTDNGFWIDVPENLNNGYVTEWDAADVLGGFTFTLADDAQGRFAIDNITGEVTVANGSALEEQSYDIEVTITDSSGNSNNRIVTIAVETVNEAPVFTLLDAITNYVDDNPPVVIDADVSIQDPDLELKNNGLGDFGGSRLIIERNTGANPDDTYNIQGTHGFSIIGNEVFLNGSLFADWVTGTPGQLEIIFNDSAAYTTQTTADINNFVRQISYANVASTPTASITLDWNFEDGNTNGNQGSGIELNATGSATVNLLNQSQITAPDLENIDEDTTLAFVGANTIQVDDGIATDEQLRVSLTVDSGVLTLGNTSGINIIGGNNSSSEILLQGLKSNINVALASLTFTPANNFNNTALIDIGLTDAFLTGLYNFNDNDATDNSIGDAQNGQLQSGATVITDATRGPVLDLDGINEYIFIPDSFSQPTSITVGGWVNLDAGAARSELISIDNRINLALDDPLSGVTGSVQTTAGQIDLASNTFIAGTGWRHVIYTVDAASGNHTLYIDGVEVATAVNPNPIDWAGASNTFIGRDQNFSNYLPGLVDDVRIYSNSLSAEQIASAAGVNGLLTHTISIDVDPVNDAPELSAIETAPVFYTENGAPVDITSNLAVSDLDGDLIDGATITISGGFVAGQDVLSFTSQFGITGSFDFATGDLALSGHIWTPH